jgi:uncharacterized protein YqgC (DUF456 family)
MDGSGLAWLGVAVMAASLFLIPLGLPGVWIMILVLAAGTWAGEVSAGLFVALLMLALLAELAEWAAVDRVGRRWGGTRRTFWGALVGGILGAIVGVPVPVVGSVLGVFVGTMAGAAVASWSEARHGPTALRAGWGALLGRAVAVALKTTAGLLILIVGGISLLVR